jgi:hypothetical protein
MYNTRMNEFEAVDTVKFVVSVPVSHADAVRQALGEAGAGKVGYYEYCSFSVRGIMRYRPMKGANPAIGEVGKFQEVEEEQIETVCYKQDLGKVIEAVKKVHPYEEIAFGVSPLLLAPHGITYSDPTRNSK